jgi:hypothetical protein
MFKFLLSLVVAVALAALYLFVAQKWSYSTGERAGWVQKISKKGWICKTWEGELALVSLPGSAVEKFNFTVHDDEVARRVSHLIGKRVSLHYEEKVGLPTSCFGETRHFITDVAETPDIPLGPGVSIPAQTGAASGAAPPPVSPQAAPAPVSPQAAPAPVAPPAVPAPGPAPAVSAPPSPVATPSPPAPSGAPAPLGAPAQPASAAPR